MIKYIRNILITYTPEVLMAKALKIANIGKNCVACGCCVKVCPKNAVRIHSGVTARVDGEKCVGCGKCAAVCPAGIISVTERGTKA